MAVQNLVKGDPPLHNLCFDSPGTDSTSESSQEESPGTPPPTFAKSRHVQTRERYTVRSIFHCTPEIAFGARMQDYITAQTKSSKKQWVYDIIYGRREAEMKIAETADLILTPDIEANTEQTSNWLAVFKDTTLRTLRDLEGKHIPLLRRARKLCVRKMMQATGLQERQIMCYFHYLPSVFQLHLHVCAPYGQYTTPDFYKIHPIDNVISNLSIDSNFYKKATITTIVIGKGDLHAIYHEGDTSASP